jgi:hypothetical protein
VGAKIIHNTTPLLAKNHVCIKPSRGSGFEISNPSYSFAAELVLVSIISDGERYCSSLLREHDSPPAAYIQERHRIQWAVPNLIHYSGADACDFAPTRKSKPLLDPRMKKLELLPKSLLVN